MSDSTKAEDKGGEAVAEEGVVMLDGPDGVAISMTPASAEQTARSLADAAARARAQEKSG